MKQSPRLIRRAEAAAAAESVLAVAVVAAVETTIRATPGNLASRAGNYIISVDCCSDYTFGSSACTVISRRCLLQTLPKRKAPARSCQNLTIGDSNARTRTIQLYQTPERTHAPAKTARQGRTPHPTQGRPSGSLERFERTRYGRIAASCRGTS